MSSFQILYSFLVSFILLFLVLTLIRKRILRINYSILWLTVSLVLLFLIVKYDWVVHLSETFNLGDPKNLFFFVSIFFLIAICIQFSIIISHLVLRIKNLAQKMTLLEYELAQQRGKHHDKM